MVAVMAPASTAAHASSERPERRSRSSLLLFLMAMLALVAAPPATDVLPPHSRRAQLKERKRLAGGIDADNFVDADGGFAILNFALIGSLLTMIVGLLVLAGFATQYFRSTNEISTAVSATDENNSTGNVQADALKPTFGFVLSIVLLLAFVSLALGFAKIKSMG